MLKSDFESKIGSAYKSESGRSIDPNTIAMIIEVVMSIIKSCTAQKVKNGLKRPILADVIISRHLKEKDLTRKDLSEIINTIHTLGDNATVSEIKDLQTQGLEDD